MIVFFIVQLPFSVCAVWLLFVLFKGHKTHSDHLLAWIMALLSVSLICGSYHMAPYPRYDRMVIYDIIMQLASLSVFPTICIYIRSLYEESKENPSTYLLFLPSVLQTTSGVVVTSLLGFGHSADVLSGLISGSLMRDRLDVLERAYMLMSHDVYYSLFFISLSLSLIYVFSKLFTGKFKFIHIISFLRGQKSSFVANILCLFFVIYFVFWGICLIFPNVFMQTASIWSSLWSVSAAFVLFLIGYVSAIPSLPGGYINLERLRHPLNAMRQSRQEFLQGIDSGPIANMPSKGYDKIMESFNRLMIAEEGFLDPEMTIDTISHKLETNRTYVSKLVNIYYGMPFRDYLNKLRIDHAKQLIKDEPDAVIDYISAKSGFQSSTQFIRKFKESEGVTPAVWRDLHKK